MGRSKPLNCFGGHNARWLADEVVVKLLSSDTKDSTIPGKAANGQYHEVAVI
jgi:hypothetical protein